MAWSHYTKCGSLPSEQWLTSVIGPMTYCFQCNFIILVFDTCNDVSLKYATRDARLHGQRPVQYHIHDETRIKHITMKRFPSHDKTKADVADYIAMKVLTNNTDSLSLSSRHPQDTLEVMAAYSLRTTPTKKQIR